MLAPQNQDLRQILIHLPCLAVRCPVLRELIGVPYFSGLTANFPPQNGCFCKKIGSCVYRSAHFHHFHNPKNPTWWPISMALTVQKKTDHNHDQSIIYTHSAIWSRITSLMKSTRPSGSSSHCYNYPISPLLWKYCRCVNFHISSQEPLSAILEINSMNIALND